MWIVSIIFLLIATAAVLVHTEAGQQFVLRRAEEMATAAGYPFTATHLRFRLADLEFSLSGFIYDERGVRIEADQLAVDIPWNIYNANGIVLNSLRAAGLRIRITSPEPVIPEPSGETARIPRIVVDELSVRNATFSYVNQATRVEVPSFEMEAARGKGTLKLSAPVFISPDTTIRIPEVGLQLSPEGTLFGPFHWAAFHGQQTVGGSAGGALRWSPSVGVTVNFETEPLTIEKWDRVIAQGIVRYEDGVLNIEGFRATRDDGELTGNARITDQRKSATLNWNGIRIDPSGFRGKTDGHLELQWQASDFSDIAGTGRVAIATRDYGNAAGSVQINNGRARFLVRADSMGADIRATVNTGLDQKLAGTFQAAYRRFGLLAAEGRLRGTLSSPLVDARLTAEGVTYNGIGPINGTARAVYRRDLVDVTSIMAQLKRSSIPDGNFQINVKAKTIDGTIPSITAQLGDFVADADGEVRASAVVSGALDSPAATLVASSGGLDIGGTHIDSVETEVHLADDLLQLKRLAAYQKEGKLEASGTVNLATEQVEGQAEVSNLQITEIRNFSAMVNVNANVSGSYREPSANLKGQLENITYEGRDHGSVLVEGAANRQAVEFRLESAKYKATVDGALGTTAPYAFTATVDAHQSPVEYNQYSFVADGRLQAAGALEPRTVDSVRLDDFSFTGEGISLKANGSLESEVNVDLIADLSQLPVEGVELTGSVEAVAALRGPIDNPTIDGGVKTRNATVKTAGMPERATVETDIAFTRDRFVIREMHARYADARVAIGGEGTLKGTGDFSFEAENVRPERFLTGRQLTGLIGVEGTARVNAPRVDAIEGHALVTQFELNARGVEVHQTQQGELKVENQIATIRNFSLEGPETTASAGGTANLATGELNLDFQADTDLRLLEGLIPRSSAFGRIDSEVAIRGTTNQPDMKGFVNLDDAQIQIDEPPLLLSEVTARMDLTGNRLQIQRAAGNLNGGAFAVTGGTELASSGLKNADIQVHLTDTTLDYPKGLETGVAAELKLNGTSPNLALNGKVSILDAIYRENINLGAQVFEQLTPEADTAPKDAPMLGFAGDINLDVTVETTGPVTVANNVAKMDLYGTFRVRGAVNDPVVLGRADVLEGGEVYFGPSAGGEAAALRERRDKYIIERGTVEFNNPLHTEPTIDFEATHDLQVKDERYAIRLKATGTPTDLRTELTSDPFLSEPDIVTMLLTGRTFADLQGAQVAVAREQLLDYVSGQLTSRFFRSAGAVLGLDTVTIEPATGAAEDDVSARLTVAKDIRNDLSLIYGQNLSGPRNQSWILNYSAMKNLVVRGINRPDQDEVRMELRHGLEFGGGPPLPRRVTPRFEPQLESVTFSQTNFSMEELAKHVAKPGSPYSVNRMNEDVRVLHEFLASNGFADAKIRTTRQTAGTKVDVHFTIEEGPRVAFEYRGMEVPESVQKDVRQIFIDSRAEVASLQQSTARVLRHLRDEGYLESRVSSANESNNPEERLYVFKLEPGPKFRDPKWVFEGIEQLDITRSAGTVLENPERIREQIESQLRGKGFLDTKATVPMLLTQPAPRFVVSVERGIQYMVSALNYNGNSAFTAPHLTRVVTDGPTLIFPPDEPGATRPPDKEEQLKPFPYTSDWVSIARRRIMTEYWQEGFNDVQIGATTHYVPNSGKIEVSFDIREGEREKIASVRIMGDEKTLRSHVQRYLRISEGDPVDFSRISLTRKRLYDTGLFKRVDIQVVKEERGNVAEINLNERAPWSVKYGFTVTDHRENQVRDRDFGVSTELTYRNLFGKGVVAGFSGKIDRSFREARLFSSFPVFFDRDVASTISLFRNRETLDDAIANTWGITLKQQWRLRDFYLLSYDYSYRRVGTLELDLTDDDPDIIDGVLPVARFNVTLTRDTRDDFFNATRGTFFSNSFDLAPPGIGSAVKYIRNYTQFMRFREIRPRLIWASAYRFGVARGFGGTNLVPSDQFTAGGATSLRAFAQDSATLRPGNALFITNQELRFPMFWRLGGVTFFDIGNVYERVSSANPFRQRYSPGFGVRIETPFVLLRLDLGFNLWARTGEDRRRISFGIGQAF
jgi:outer membrane protein assembly factor BamA/autotransporter translocation and assembly factor TamB